MSWLVRPLDVLDQVIFFLWVASLFLLPDGLVFAFSFLYFDFEEEVIFRVSEDYSDRLEAQVSGELFTTYVDEVYIRALRTHIRCHLNSIDDILPRLKHLPRTQHLMYLHCKQITDQTHEHLIHQRKSGLKLASARFGQHLDGDEE